MLKIVFALFILSATTAMAFDLQGHRGARGLEPENTLPSFARAIAAGASTLELDVGIFLGHFARHFKEKSVG